MIVFIITQIILFLIIFFIWGNLYKIDSGQKIKLHRPLGMVLLIFIISLIPCFGLAVLISVIIFGFTFFMLDGYCFLNKENKIIKFLEKDI